MAGPGVYEKRRIKKERRALAEKMADMPGFYSDEGEWVFTDVDPYSNVNYKYTGTMPAQNYANLSRQVARWQKQGTLPSDRGSPAPSVPSQTPTTPATTTPWYPQPFEAPPGQYQRWANWYSPGASVSDQPHVQWLNALLPFLAEEDIPTVARQLYIASGGPGGPLAKYLQASEYGVPPFTRPGEMPTDAQSGPQGLPPWVRTLNRRNEEFPYSLGVPQEVMEWEQSQRRAAQGGPQGLPPWVRRHGDEKQVTIEPWDRRQSWRPEGWPAPPEQNPYQDVLKQISGVLSSIQDPTAQAWAQSVFDVYQDWTPQMGMRTSEEEAVFQAQLADLFENVPEAAQPYAAVLQRLVMPTIRRPGQEWYELAAPERTTPTNLKEALNLRWNPAWM